MKIAYDMNFLRGAFTSDDVMKDFHSHMLSSNSVIGVEIFEMVPRSYRDDKI